ncbi:MAG TPA: type 1 glutamine amidotransferase domain-containing protein [Actinospica sp.]|jgi:protease I|nr:type 1 glutamine amidotransferase domain-containing protein [Actinospica sp.]
MTFDTPTASSTGFDSAALAGATVAFLIAPEGAEQSETIQPWEAVTLAGGRAVLVCPEAGEAQLFEHLDRGIRMPVDRKLADADPGDFDALVLPGGVANPDMLRTDLDAVHFAIAFLLAGKPIAAICHAPWLLVEAGMVRDRMLTSWPSLRTDIANAGGIWHDRPVVVCRNGPNVLVTSRKPDDLPQFCGTLVEEFAPLAQPGVSRAR